MKTLNTRLYERIDENYYYILNSETIKRVMKNKLDYLYKKIILKIQWFIKSNII